MENLTKHFRFLSQAAYARHGFASEQLISQWGVIVGPEIAHFCQPTKISWPKGAAALTRKMGGTLHLRATQGRALELQYESHRIIERVNQFLGYGAITTLKIMQSSDVPKVKALPKQVGAENLQAWASRFEPIADNELKQALLRLASKISPNGPKPTSPQVENGVGLSLQTQLGKNHD